MPAARKKRHGAISIIAYAFLAASLYIHQRPDYSFADINASVNVSTEDTAMATDPFLDRLTRVRDRFAAKLASKIDETHAAIPQLSDAVPAAAAAVDEAYRCVHGIVGVGPTVGFPQSGRAAHDVENVLRSPRIENRGLTAGEIQALTKALQELRQAAACELQSFHAAVA
jgi:HPt (histidine-containing phosphotransfer) domain-containing protein